MAKRNRLSTKSIKGNTQAGAVRYLPGFGTKYLLREDGRLFRRNRDNEYIEVAQSEDGRVRLYHLGTESRRYVHVLKQIVFPEASDDKILEIDREVPPGGSLDDLARVPRDEVGDVLEDLYEDFDGSAEEFPADDSGIEDKTPESLSDEFFEL